MEHLIIKNLKALRCFLQLTQAQFSDAVGVSESLVSRLETGDREPSAGFVARVCQTFHVRPNTIYETDMMAEASESVVIDTAGEASHNA